MSEPRRPVPNEADLRRGLLGFADLIRRLNEQGGLVRNLPLILGRLGDLRRLIFEYEVRVTERLLPAESEAERDARRIVREALERAADAENEWDSTWHPPEATDEDGEEEA